MNEFKPITVNRRSSLEERKLALHYIYRQVLDRQPYDFERQLLKEAENDFLKDKIGVRRFLKHLGQSEVYLEAFYHRYSNVKFIELCFKHFLGRAPNRGEVQIYGNSLATVGVKNFINQLLDTEEYRKSFGCFTVPYPREQTCYDSPNAYLETQILNREHVRQRGMSVPTMYWRQLGLRCEAGVCRHPEVVEAMESPKFQEGKRLQAQLQQLLKLFESDGAKEALASLPPKQLEKLREAIG